MFHVIHPTGRGDFPDGASPERFIIGVDFNINEIQPLNILLHVTNASH